LCQRQRSFAAKSRGDNVVVGRECAKGDDAVLKLDLAQSRDGGDVDQGLRRSRACDPTE
jgi:hypothetical protein